MDARCIKRIDTDKCDSDLTLLQRLSDDQMSVPSIHIIASILAWGSAIVNPFIYAFKNRQYQQAFTRVSQLPQRRNPVFMLIWSLRKALHSSPIYTCRPRIGSCEIGSLSGFMLGIRASYNYRHLSLTEPYKALQTLFSGCLL